MIQPASIQVRFADCDMMGHVNNAIYLSYFEQARMHYFQQIVGEKWDWQKEGIILVKNEVEYISPVFLNESPLIFVKLEEVGTTSFLLSYKVEVDGKLKAKGISKLVCYDFTRMKSVPVYPKMKKGLLKLK